MRPHKGTVFLGLARPGELCLGFSSLAVLSLLPALVRSISWPCRLAFLPRGVGPRSSWDSVTHRQLPVLGLLASSARGA